MWRKGTEKKGSEACENGIEGADSLEQYSFHFDKCLAVLKRNTTLVILAIAVLLSARQVPYGTWKRQPLKFKA